MPGPIRALSGPANARSTPDARSLRDDFPAALEAFGTELAHTDALAILTIAPTPERARGLSRTTIAAALRRAGRQRNLDRRATEIQSALRTEQPEGPSQIAEAFGAATQARVAVLVSLNGQIAELERALSEHVDRHPDAEILEQSARTRCGPRRPGAWRVR